MAEILAPVKRLTRGDQNMTMYYAGPNATWPYGVMPVGEILVEAGQTIYEGHVFNVTPWKTAQLPSNTLDVIGTTDSTAAALYGNTGTIWNSGTPLTLILTGIGTFTPTQPQCASFATYAAALTATYPVVTLHQGGNSGKNVVITVSAASIVVGAGTINSGTAFGLTAGTTSTSIRKSLIFEGNGVPGNPQAIVGDGVTTYICGYTDVALFANSATNPVTNTSVGVCYFEDSSTVGTLQAQFGVAGKIIGYDNQQNMVWVDMYATNP